MSLYNELKRRNVFRVAIAYLALAWLLTEVSGTLFPAFGVPEWGVRFVVIVCALGFVPAVIISWAYEITPEGLKREKDVVRDDSITHVTAKRLDGITIGLIVVALGFILVDRLWLGPRFAKQVAAPAEVVTDTVQTPEPDSQYPLNSIAVLPFVNMSSDSEQEYFSDGISEELLNLLAKIPEMRVTSRSSAFSFKGTNMKIADVARELNVAHVLEGSVRKEGNRVRITAQLIDARSDTHLWSETYDRTMDEIFAIQDEIAATVIEALKITLLGEIPSVPQADPEAYTLFLLADHLRAQGTSESLNRSTALLKQALAIDPDFAIAWRNLAVRYDDMNRLYGDLSADEAYTLALEAVEKALAIDPDYAIAYTTLGGIILDYEGNIPKAAEQYSRALELDSYHQTNLNNAGQFLLALGRLNETIAVYEYLLTRDPLNTYALLNLAEASLFAGDPDQAITSGETLLTLTPGRGSIQYIMGRAFLLKGQVETALEVFKQEPLEYFRLLGEIMAYQVMGQQDASDAALEVLISNHSQGRAFYIAGALAYRNEPDRAFEWLERAAVNDETNLVWIAAESLFSNIHEDPRWLPFLESRKMSPAQLDAIEFKVTLPD